MSEWLLSSSSDKRALAVVDGLGKFRRYGPHYSRRTPGSKTFTGVGQEIVLLHASGRAVWACIRQKTPSKVGSGASRGRSGETDRKATFVWRNMMFCNRYAGVASDLIRSATERTYEEWEKRYHEIPSERLRTEIDVRKVKNKETPGRCYVLAGWEYRLNPKTEKPLVKNGKIFLYAPLHPSQALIVMAAE